MTGNRLECILSQLTDIHVLADIGTDHAYVPVAACLRGLAQTAIACDMNPGPLKKAEANIRAYKLEHRIKTRLGDGLAPLAKGEADGIVIAGMGGMRIAGILTDRLETAQSAGLLVLQPQHDIPRLRQILHKNNFAIVNELMTREDGHFYTLLTAKPCAAPEAWTETEYGLGKHLLARKCPVLFEFIQKETDKLTGYITEAPARSARLDTLRTKLAMYTEACRAWR